MTKMAKHKEILLDSVQLISSPSLTGTPQVTITINSSEDK